MARDYDQVASADTGPSSDGSGPDATVPKRLVSQSTHHLAAAIVTTALPVIGILSWAASVVVAGDGLRPLSHAMGGRFTQAQAKAVDVVASALLAPLVFIGLNWYWFAALRVTVFNETSARAVPLLTLVEASKTERGSFDLVKIARLLRAGSRMAALGLVVVLSAVAQTSFANVVAYEAYGQDDAGPPVTLSPLVSDVFPRLDVSHAIQVGFREPEFGSVQSQMVQLLADMSFHGPRNSTFRNGAYIGLNVTKASLDAQPASTIRLFDVPAFRLSSECKPLKPVAVSMQSSAGYQPYLSMQFDPGRGTSNKTSYFQTQFPGTVTAITGTAMGEQLFVAFKFPGKATSAYLAYMQRFNATPSTSPYGNITYQAFNMSAQLWNLNGQFPFKGEKEIMSFGGIECSVLRQAGFLNLTRRPDLTWQWPDSAFGSPWPGAPTPVDMILPNFEKQPVFQYPLWSGYIAGLGPVLYRGGRPISEATAGPDFRAAADNLVYASGESERIVYETKHAANNGSSTASPVRSLIRGQHYRITYVPVLLVLGLVCTLAAAAISLTLVLAAVRSHSFKTWRDVDSLRLLVDGAEALHADPDMQSVQAAINKEQGEMAGKMAVRYVFDHGQGIVLRKLNALAGGKEAARPATGEDASEPNSSSGSTSA